MQVGWENLQGFSEVYVAFEDTNCLWWLKFLKPGFRHCYVILVAAEKQAGKASSCVVKSTLQSD